MKPSRLFFSLFCLFVGGANHLAADDAVASPVPATMTVAIADSRFHAMNADPDFNLCYSGEKIILKVRPAAAARFLSVEVKDAWVPLGEVAEPVFSEVKFINAAGADLTVPIDLKGRLGAWRIACQLLDGA